MSDIRVGHIRQVARGILKKYGQVGPPIAPEAVAAGEGLEVRVVSTWPDKLSGLLLRESGLIGLNGKHAPARRRFSLAHELGHWFLRHDITWDENEVTIDAPPHEEQENEAARLREAEANEFAGELLAPREMLKQALARVQDPSELAELFGISAEALWVRIVRHNLLK